MLQADVLRWLPARPLDAVYEQTCLCALHPDHWVAYAAQLHSWLRAGGRLFALFMQARRDDAAGGIIQGPPYHCDINAMRALFPAARMAVGRRRRTPAPHPDGLARAGAMILTRR